MEMGTFQPGSRLFFETMLLCCRGLKVLRIGSVMTFIQLLWKWAFPYLPFMIMLYICNIFGDIDSDLTFPGWADIELKLFHLQTPLLYFDPLHKRVEGVSLLCSRWRREEEWGGRQGGQQRTFNNAEITNCSPGRREMGREKLRWWWNKSSHGGLSFAQPLFLSGTVGQFPKPNSKVHDFSCFEYYRYYHRRVDCLNGVAKGDH